MFSPAVWGWLLVFKDLKFVSSMPLVTPNTFYLCNAEYLQEKCRVSVEFSNLSESRRVSFAFTPHIFIHDFSLVSLNAFFSANKKLRTERVNNGVKVFSSDFSFLKELNSVAEKKGILLSPERQFLLSKDWSFFDEFEFNGEFKNKGFRKIPEIRFNFSSAPLNKDISEMLSFSNDSGKKFLSKIVFSNILCEKPELIPDSKAKILDLFLEKVLFKNNFAFLKQKPKFDSGFQKKPSEKLKKIDFSSVWPALFSFPFYNIGFDSINCSCCKPESLQEKNILPSSLIEVKFLEDAIYFESSNKNLSFFFHENALGKEKRIKRMNEWKLKNIPLGPFFRNDVLRIPLEDALKLKTEQKISFLSDHEIEWFCRKKESFLSRELNELNRKIILSDRKINEAELDSIKKKGIAFSLFLDEDSEFNFFSEYRKALKTIFSTIPFHLSSASTAFFDFNLSNSINCIFSSVLNRFKEFSQTNSSVSFVEKDAVLLDSSDNALDLVTEFSRSEKIPLPQVELSKSG